MILKSDIGELLKEARLEAGLTQEELAEKAKIPQPGISRAEKEGCGITMFSELLDAMGFILVIDYKARSDRHQPCTLCGSTEHADKRCTTKADDPVSDLVVKSVEPTRTHTKSATTKENKTNEE